MIRTTLLALGTIGLFACSSTTNNTTNNFGSQPVPAADCSTRCEKKAGDCGAPSADAKQACGGICDGTYTNDQLSCLEGKSCSELQNGSLSSLCPKDSGSSGGSSGSSGGSSGSSGSSGSTQKYSCSLNGTCYKCNDSAGVSKCSIKDGPGPGCTETDSSYCN